MTMATVRHPDTYVCDICGAGFSERRSVNVPVLWVTEQDDGRGCDPHFGVEALDLCEACADRVHVVEASGAMGRNAYRFRDRDGGRG